MRTSRTGRMSVCLPTLRCRLATIAHHRRGAADRRAYTLLELVFVLSLFGLVAGLSWPMLMRPWSKSRVQQAAQDLSRELLRTRLNAIEQGQVFRFRWRPGTAEYEIRPWTSPVPPIELLSTESGSAGIELPLPPTAQTDATTADSLDPTDEVRSSPDPSLHRPALPQATELPAGITFFDSDRSLDPIDDVLRQTESASVRDDEPVRAAGPTTQDDSSAQQDSADVSANTPWAPPVWFYPDGRTTNARWTLVADDGYLIDVRLRGWVGTVQVGPVLRRENLDAQTEAVEPEALRPERPEPALP